MNNHEFIEGSSKGRIAVFEAANLGSNPSPSANFKDSMDIITTISSIVGLAQGIYSLKERAMPEAKKDAVAKWLNKISETLVELEAELRNGHYPHDKCGYLHFSMNSLVDTLNVYLSFTEVDNLYRYSEQAHQVERLFHDLKNLSDEQREANLGKILEASGVMEACADYLLTR